MLRKIVQGIAPVTFMRDEVPPCSGSSGRTGSVQFGAAHAFARPAPATGHHPVEKVGVLKIFLYLPPLV
jgi:hypothetical protein